MSKEELKEMAADIESAVISLSHKGVRDPKAFKLLTQVKDKLIQKQQQ